jgi:hypothetical protein
LTSFDVLAHRRPSAGRERGRTSASDVRLRRVRSADNCASDLPGEPQGLVDRGVGSVPPQRHEVVGDVKILEGREVEGLERGDVDDVDAVVERAGDGLLDQVVVRPKDGGQRLPGPGRRRDQRVPAGRDGGSAVALGLGGPGKRRLNQVRTAGWKREHGIHRLPYRTSGSARRSGSSRVQEWSVTHAMAG